MHLFSLSSLHCDGQTLLLPAMPKLRRDSRLGRVVDFAGAVRGFVSRGSLIGVVISRTCLFSMESTRICRESIDIGRGQEESVLE